MKPCTYPSGQQLPTRPLLCCREGALRQARDIDLDAMEEVLGWQVGVGHGTRVVRQKLVGVVKNRYLRWGTYVRYWLAGGRAGG